MRAHARLVIGLPNALNRKPRRLKVRLRQQRHELVLAVARQHVAPPQLCPGNAGELLHLRLEGARIQRLLALGFHERHQAQEHRRPRALQHALLQPVYARKHRPVAEVRAVSPLVVQRVHDMADILLGAVLRAHDRLIERRVVRAPHVGVGLPGAAGHLPRIGQLHLQPPVKPLDLQRMAAQRHDLVVCPVRLPVILHGIDALDIQVVVVHAPGHDPALLCGRGEQRPAIQLDHAALQRHAPLVQHRQLARLVGQPFKLVYIHKAVGRGVPLIETARGDHGFLQRLDPLALHQPAVAVQQGSERGCRVAALPVGPERAEQLLVRHRPAVLQNQILQKKVGFARLLQGNQRRFPVEQHLKPTEQIDLYLCLTHLVFSSIPYRHSRMRHPYTQY